MQSSTFISVTFIESEKNRMLKFLTHCAFDWLNITAQKVKANKKNKTKMKEQFGNKTKMKEQFGNTIIK